MKQVQFYWKKYINLLAPIRNTKKSVFALVAVPMLAIATAGIVYAVTASNAHNRGVVLFAGDSNIVLASGIVENQFNDYNSFVPVFAARTGRGIRSPDCLVLTGCTTNNYWQTKLAETFKKVQPDAVVTNLGINDTPAAGSSTSLGYAWYNLKIDWFMNLLPRTKPVYWSNLPCDIEPPSRQTGCQIVNSSLTKAMARWPNLHVLDWASIANSHPEYMGLVGTELGIHYTGEGHTAWGLMVKNALNARFPMPSN